MLVSAEQVASAVVELFQDISGTDLDMSHINSKIIASDENYQTISPQALDTIYTHNIPPFTFNPNDEMADCDDFSLYLKYITTAIKRKQGWKAPPAVGLIRDCRHAFNFFIEATNGEAQAWALDTTLNPPLFTKDPSVIENTILQEVPLLLVYY
jgi:hypothetical protein